MNGLALGGSHGLFTNPGKAVGRIFSLKNLVPDVTTAAGAFLGGPIGAGVGSFAGHAIEGQPLEQAALGGLETGALDFATAGLLGAGDPGGALAGTAVGSALSDVGGALSGVTGDLSSSLGSIGGDLGLGGVASAAGATASGAGGTLLGNAIDSVGSDLGLGSTNLLGQGVNSLGADIGLGGGAAASGANAALAANGTALTAGNPLLTAGGTGGIQAAPALEVAGASAPAAAAAGSTATGGLFSGGLGTDLKLGLVAAPLALDVLRGNQPVKGQNQINADAAQFAAQGAANENYLATGTLPPGAQAAINQAVTAAQTAIKSQYAARGMSGSSAEQQDLQNAATNGVTQATNLATQLLNTGIRQSEFSAQLYQGIMNQSMQQDQALGQSIGNLAAALAA